MSSYLFMFVDNVNISFHIYIFDVKDGVVDKGHNNFSEATSGFEMDKAINDEIKQVNNMYAKDEQYLNKYSKKCMQAIVSSSVSGAVYTLYKNRAVLNQITINAYHGVDPIKNIELITWLTNNAFKSGLLWGSVTSIATFIYAAKFTTAYMLCRHLIPEKFYSHGGDYLKGELDQQKIRELARRVVQSNLENQKLKEKLYNLNISESKKTKINRNEADKKE